MRRHLQSSQSHLLLAVALSFVAGAAFAQTHASPLPPPRPANIGAQPPAPARQQASPAAADQGVDQLPPLDPDHPPVLPASSRAKMRACGKEWEAMKMAGKDGMGWRAFATSCLTH